MSELNKIALKILSNGKGILAADESNGTMTKRLESVNVPSSPENRLLFRETLFSSSGMKDFIGGVILYDETINQTSNLKQTIPELISKSGAVPGIKVDTGAKILAGSHEEKITEGLDGLRERLQDYYKLGARFTKWRGVYNINKECPSKIAIHSNAHALARYSAIVQECGMVPIVEPEVLMDGDHSAEENFDQFSSSSINWPELMFIIFQIFQSDPPSEIENASQLLSGLTLAADIATVPSSENKFGSMSTLSLHESQSLTISLFCCQ